MKFLLDTHIIIWLIEGNKQLESEALEIITDKDNEIYYSTISIWEVALKKMTHPNDISISGSKLSELCIASGLKSLSLNDKHVKKLESIGCNDKYPEHKDPFDRMLYSQAKSENMILITHDPKIEGYGKEFVLKI